MPQWEPQEIGRFHVDSLSPSNVVRGHAVRMRCSYRLNQEASQQSRLWIARDRRLSSTMGRRTLMLLLATRLLLMLLG